MLVLSRKASESILIGDDIKITVLSVKGDRVTIGITAPRDMDIHRPEVLQKIKQEVAAADE